MDSIRIVLAGFVGMPENADLLVGIRLGALRVTTPSRFARSGQGNSSLIWERIGECLVARSFSAQGCAMLKTASVQSYSAPICQLLQQYSGRKLWNNNKEEGSLIARHQYSQVGYSYLSATFHFWTVI